MLPFTGIACFARRFIQGVAPLKVHRWRFTLARHVAFVVESLSVFAQVLVTAVSNSVLTAFAVIFK